MSKYRMQEEEEKILSGVNIIPVIDVAEFEPVAILERPGSP